MTNARPGNNGNSPKSFRDAGLALHNTTFSAITEIRQAVGETFHARNYQHLPPVEGALARLEDMRRMNEAIEALNALAVQAVEIFKAGEE